MLALEESPGKHDPLPQLLFAERRLDGQVELDVEIRPSLIVSAIRVKTVFH
jgi:hypothetical protein